MPSLHSAATMGRDDEALAEGEENIQHKIKQFIQSHHDQSHHFSHLSDSSFSHCLSSLSRHFPPSPVARRAFDPPPPQPRFINTWSEALAQYIASADIPYPLSPVFVSRLCSLFSLFLLPSWPGAPWLRPTGDALIEALINNTRSEREYSIIHSLLASPLLSCRSHILLLCSLFLSLSAVGASRPIGLAIAEAPCAALTQILASVRCVLNAPDRLHDIGASTDLQYLLYFYRVLLDRSQAQFVPSLAVKNQTRMNLLEQFTNSMPIYAIQYTDSDADSAQSLLARTRLFSPALAQAGHEYSFIGGPEFHDSSKYNKRHAETNILQPRRKIKPTTDTATPDHSIVSVRAEAAGAVDAAALAAEFAIPNSRSTSAYNIPPVPAFDVLLQSPPRPSPAHSHTHPQSPSASPSASLPPSPHTPTQPASSPFDLPDPAAAPACYDSPSSFPSGRPQSVVPFSGVSYYSPCSSAHGVTRSPSTLPLAALRSQQQTLHAITAVKKKIRLTNLDKFVKNAPSSGLASPASGAKGAAPVPLFDGSPAQAAVSSPASSKSPGSVLGVSQLLSEIAAERPVSRLPSNLVRRQLL